MKLSPFAIKQISELSKDIMTGTKWVDFFNSFGARDVYDNALPDIGKPNHIRPSKKEYIAKRLADLNDTIYLQQAVLRLATLSEFYPEALNNCIIPEKYLWGELFIAKRHTPSSLFPLNSFYFATSRKIVSSRTPSPASGPATQCQVLAFIASRHDVLI